MAKGKSINGRFDCQKLIAFRKKQNVKSGEFADKLGISKPYYSKIENGYKQPSSAVNKLICFTLCVPEDEFIIKQELPESKPEEPVPDKQMDRIEAQLDRMERKLDRLEMITRSIQNENLALRQELLKRK